MVEELPANGAKDGEMKQAQKSRSGANLRSLVAMFSLSLLGGAPP